MKTNEQIARLLKDASAALAEAANALETQSMKEKPQSEYVTRADAARILGRSAAYITRATQEGRLLCSEAGLISRADLEAFAKAGKPIKPSPSATMMPGTFKKGATIKRIV